ncbi:MAG: 1-acyl-sn-glycerol-3-phosphate acyltransferase [Bacteroidetes bacterium]|nr:1-acyl-sn-glycerol-3-phosphate acyltransferase [Bacteroidota bacterium]
MLTLILLYPVFYILLSREKWFGHVFKLKKIWAKMILYNVGIRCKVLSAPLLKSDQPYIICPNHASFLDIVTTYIVIPNYFHFMGKAELKKVPLFNKFFENMNILVDRSSIIGSHKAFMRAGSDIDKGISIAIFPEATIPACAPILGRYKNGAFKLAIDKQIPIVPVVYLDNWRILPDGVRRKTGGMPGVSRVVIHDPIPTKGLNDSDLDHLKKKVHEVIQNTLNEYGCCQELHKKEKPVTSS